MKAVVITPYYFPKIGGLENYARQLNLALDRNQAWEIVNISTNPRFRSRREVIDGQQIYRLGTWLKLSNTPLSPLWPFQIRKIIKHEKPDLIIAHSPVPSMADAAVLAKGATPLVVIYHAATLFKQGSPVFNLIARLYDRLGKYTLRRANHIFAVSDFVRQQFSAGLQQKTTVVPNAVWHKELATRPQPEIGTHNFIFIGSLDRSHSWKGLTAIIQAVARYKQVQSSKVTLTIIGDGNKRSDYEQQVTKLGLTDNVTFLGTKIGADKTRELRQATALIAYPTTANDAFPTVILEAWSQHVPVIAAAIGPMPSLINDKSDGYLCAPNSPIELADAMQAVSSTPKASRAALAATAASRVKESYTWERQAALVNKLAGELL